jgi:PKD repeat protein
MMANRLATRLTLCGAATVLTAACAVSSVEVPNLSGPSEFALSYQVAANPDSIRHDGGDASTIVVTARDSDGKPKSGLTLRVDILAGGLPANEFGTLTNRTVVTGSDGTARTMYIAPPAPPINSPLNTCSLSGEVLLGTCIQIAATPIGSTSYGELPTQSAMIRLIPPALILPPPDPTAPIASFSYSPTSPKKGTQIIFTAEASAASPGRRIVQYNWSWGDGQGANRTGPLEDHDYVDAGLYPVVLTVIDDAGVSGASVQIINVLP